MITRRSAYAVAACLVACLGRADAAQIFLSTSTTDPTPVNPALVLQPGDSATLHVWVLPTATELLNGVFLNVTASTPGITQGTAAAVHNPQAFGGRTPQNRWQGTGAGTLGNLVTGLSGVRVTSGAGIDGAFDEDPNAFFVSQTPRAYRFATIDFEAVAAGTTDIFLRVGSGLIAQQGVGAATVFFGAGEVNPITANTANLTGTLADATITVVPEPASVALAAVAMALLLPARWRR